MTPEIDGSRSNGGPRTLRVSYPAGGITVEHVQPRHMDLTVLYPLSMHRPEFLVADVDAAFRSPGCECNVRGVCVTICRA